MQLSDELRCYKAPFLNTTIFKEFSQVLSQENKLHLTLKAYQELFRNEKIEHLNSKLLLPPISIFQRNSNKINHKQDSHLSRPIVKFDPEKFRMNEMAIFAGMSKKNIIKNLKTVNVTQKKIVFFGKIIFY